MQFIDGDTDRVAFGMGSNGSRSMVVGGSALTLAAGKIIDKGKQIAAHLLEAAEADIEFAEGRFSVAGTDRGVTLKDVARAAFQPARLPPGMEPGFYEHATYAPTRNTFPNGCHVCEVEIDPDTGVVELAVLPRGRRRRHSDQSADAGRPDSRRRRARASARS